MKKVLSLVITLILILSGCGSLPVYEMEGDIENVRDVRVMIDGVEYSALPESLWIFQPGSEVIGYAGSKSVQIINAEGDTNRNFIFLNDRSTIEFEVSLMKLHRIDLPEPSADWINRIEFHEQIFVEDGDIRKDNTITDQEKINALFEILETGERTVCLTMPDRTLWLTCYSDVITGATYALYFTVKGNKWMCGSAQEGYVEIPQELLDAFAGYSVSLQT